MNKNFLKRAQQMQIKLQQAQIELENTTVEGSAGGGAVKIVMNGKQIVESVFIDNEVSEDIEMLQDLVLAAFNDASVKIQAKASNTMGAITGGMGMPGFM
jgi:hypothetical protein